MLKIITASAAAMLSLASASVTAATVNNISQFPGLEKYTGYSRYPEAPRALNYTADGATYLQMSADGKRIVKHDTKTGKELETLMDLTNTRETTLESIEGYELSPDGSKILVYRNRKMIYRRSFEAEYFVYEIRTRILKPISTEHPRQRAAMFSPNGRIIAFVADNNIYLRKLDYWTEVAVTTDGSINQVINGVPDWTYEEEFSTAVSMTWSPDNRNLCFLKYDESKVPQFYFPLYEGACDAMPEYKLYPGKFTYKYPVAGERNSTVTVHSYDVETRKVKQIKLPDSKIEYIPRITYAYSPERLIIVALNREQTRMEIYSANPMSTVVKSLLVEESDAWLSTDTYEAIHYTPQGFYILSSRSGYDHIYQYSYSGSLVKQITSGDYDVTAYYGYDQKHAAHYYQSTSHGAVNRTVSRIDRNGKVTDVSPAEGTANARFSPDMAYYTLSYSSVSTAPRYSLVSSTGDKVVKVLEDNAEYMQEWANEPVKEFFTMESDGNKLNGWILKPKDFSASKKYPVIMFQYSGPGSQQVLNQWGVNWMNYYTQQGYIIMCVDGRGTGGRGRKFMTCVYKDLGHYESIDQVNAAKYAASLPYVDSKRIGIHGWSYGGYETLMASSQPDAPYAAAVAVAPVTDWRYYDTIYAERYMLTPQQNPDGYKVSAPVNRAANVKCPLLIMTGTADDNVHFFNTVQYVANLQMAGGWCDLLIFPNMNHSINGCQDQTVVYARMLDYFNRNMR